MAPLGTTWRGQTQRVSITTHKVATGLDPRASFQRASVKLVPVLELILVSMSRLGDSSWLAIEYPYGFVLGGCVHCAGPPRMSSPATNLWPADRRPRSSTVVQ